MLFRLICSLSFIVAAIGAGFTSHNSAVSATGLEKSLLFRLTHFTLKMNRLAGHRSLNTLVLKAQLLTP